MSRMLIVDVVDAAARLYGLPRSEILGEGRTAHVAWVRQACMYIAARRCQRSTKDIGFRFGGRDHSTVLFAIRKVGQLIQTDPDVRKEVGRLLMAAQKRAQEPDWRRETVKWLVAQPNPISAARAPTGGRYPPHWVPPEARG